MEATLIDRALMRISHEIVERHRSVEKLALVGIRTRGVPIAQRIAKNLQGIVNKNVACGELDITLYRDDLMRQTVGPQPILRKTEIPFSIDDQKILLVDDVITHDYTISQCIYQLGNEGPKDITVLCAGRTMK